MSEAHELVNRHIAAFNAQNVDALLADFTTSATWVTGDYAVGEGDLREFFTSAMQSSTSLVGRSRGRRSTVKDQQTHESARSSLIVVSTASDDEANDKFAQIIRAEIADKSQ